MASSLRVAVSAHWAGGEADRAAALAIEGVRATSGRPEGSVAWLMLLEQLAQPVVEEARVARESARETPRKDGGRLPALRLERLAPLAPCLALLPASHFCSDPASASAVTYWKLALWLGAATGALDDTGHALARCITSGAPPESAPLTSPVPTPTAAGAVPDRIIVSGAGCIAADGVYTRSGEFQGVARFIHQVGQLWLIRYRLPNGSNWWYIADKDQLDRNDGDLYRVRVSDERHQHVPPTEGWTLAHDGQSPVPSFAFESIAQVQNAAVGPTAGRYADGRYADERRGITVYLDSLRASADELEPTPSALRASAMPASAARGGLFSRLFRYRSSSRSSSITQQQSHPRAAAAVAAPEAAAPAGPEPSEWGHLSQIPIPVLAQAGLIAAAEPQSPLAQLLREEFGEVRLPPSRLSN